MRTFSEFVETRTLHDFATQLVENDVDVDEFCNYVKNVATTFELSEAQLYNELRAGLGNLLRQGLGAAGNAARGVGSAIGNAASRVGNAVGNAAQAGMNAARNAGTAVGNAAQAGMTNVRNSYMQGENQQKIQVAMQKIQDLQKFLVSLGIASPDRVQAAFQKLVQQLQGASQNIANNPAARFGQPSMFPRSAPHM